MICKANFKVFHVLFSDASRQASMIVGTCIRISVRKSLLRLQAQSRFN